MIRYEISRAEPGPSDWLRLDTKGFPLNIYTISVEFENIDGAQVTVEFTLDRDLDNAQPISHHILCGITQSTTSHMQGPMAAIRLNLTSHSAGTITLKVLQS